MDQLEKTIILEKFITLFKESGLKNKEAAERLGIQICYINWMKNEKTVRKLGPKALNAMNDFINSGKKLSQYQCGEKVFINRNDEEQPLKTEPPEEKPVKKTANLFTKERLAGILIPAMENAGMNNIEVARILGITTENISLIRNERLRESCPDKVFEAIKRWTESGKNLKDYNYLQIGVKTKETLTESTEGHKFILDIEINLTINGRRVVI